MKKVQVMGAGCTKCEQLAVTAQEAINEAGVEAEVVKVQDFQEIAAFGVFSTPALAIDGVVKIVGMVPSKDDIVGWLK